LSPDSGCSCPHNRVSLASRLRLIWRPNRKEVSMLNLLLPLAYRRYASLPVLGGVLENLCTWLQGKGFPLNAIRRRIVAARFLDECLRARGVLSLSGCTALQLKACLPREKRWTPQIAYSLGRSLLEYLQERGELTTVAPTPSEQIVEAYRDYLQRV